MTLSLETLVPITVMGWHLQLYYPFPTVFILSREQNHPIPTVKLTPCFSPSWCFAVPPRLTLSCDVEGNPVCEAAAGKPAAQISWVPESNSSPENKSHDNETVTVLSRFTAESTNLTNATCIVSHLTGNQSKSITCHPSGKLPFVCLVFKILVSLLSTLLFHWGRKIYKCYRNSYRDNSTIPNYLCPETSTACVLDMIFPSFSP